MGWKTNYARWTNASVLVGSLKEELEEMAANDELLEGYGSCCFFISKKRVQ